MLGIFICWALGNLAAGLSATLSAAAAAAEDEDEEQDPDAVVIIASE